MASFFQGLKQEDSSNKALDSLKKDQTQWESLAFQQSWMCLEVLDIFIFLKFLYWRMDFKKSDFISVYIHTLSYLLSL